MATEKVLSARWAGTTPEARRIHMRALARRRMALLTPQQRVTIARRLVAARRSKKHGTHHA